MSGALFNFRAVMAVSRKILVWHIVGCVVFLTLPVFLFPHPPEEKDFIFSRPTQRDFIGNVIMLGIFYLNYFLLIPKLFQRRKYAIYVLCIVIGFLIIAIVPSLLTGHRLFYKEISMDMPTVTDVHRLPKPEGFTFVEEIRHHIFLYVAIILFSILLKIRDRLLDIEQARHQAEVVALKDQINPHFLFNVLNCLYGLAVRDKSASTATGILKLSGMMRYVVTETGNGMVSLEKEISYINDFIELQKLRLDKRIQLSYRVVGDAGARKIAPLTLMPFIENAFKHGVNPDEDSHINILIEVYGRELKLVVENNKVNVDLAPYERSGKGIENTKSRLALLYPLRHFLIVNEDDKHFRVQLTIQL